MMLGKLQLKVYMSFFRQEQTIDLINKLKAAGVNTILLEEETSDNRFEGKNICINRNFRKIYKR